MKGARLTKPLTFSRQPLLSAIVKDTKTPEYRERPPRLHLTNAKRGNPAVVRQTGKPDAQVSKGWGQLGRLARLWAIGEQR